MKFKDSVEVIKGVGEVQARKFARLGIHSVEDLLRHYPRKYQDYSHIQNISDIKPGEVTLAGTFKQVKGRYVRRGMHITEAVLSDTSGSVRIVWFNQPYRAASIKEGQKYYVSGIFQLSAQRMSLMNPSSELVSSFPVNTARIIPVYSETKNLKSSDIRKALAAVLREKIDIPDLLPEKIRLAHKLLPVQEAYRQIHFPKNTSDVEIAKRRLGFEEVFELILAHLASKQELAKQKALPVPFELPLAKKFIHHLPFDLTGSQRLAVWETYKDMGQKEPMNRLVEGDVGSGKTVVAAMAAVMAITHDYQVALMAPTEILARQHGETIEKLLRPLGQADKVCLLVGSMNAKQKEVAYGHIKSGQAKFIIGTHAIIQEKVDMHTLALVIIDEQHRFGVEQRKKLLKKAGHMPHMLSMTATPIPRSLALTVYGDLDVSILREMPPGRKPIVTKLVPATKRIGLYNNIDDSLSKGQQIFVVCPLINETDLVSAKSVTEVHKELSTAIYPKRKVGLLHGKMKSDDKQAIMQDFIDKKLDVLVSTTVIEVGVDVPNATIMCIEGPERFGLAQIHQLRGRVGRDSQQGYCYLMLSDDKSPSKRLRAVSQSNDGFGLAELDLQLRGPGAIYGTSQHGQLDLRIASLSDMGLIKEARQAAKQCLSDDPTLLQYKGLSERINSLQKIVHLN